MKEHLSSASLKSLAKGQLLGKYGTVIGACAIHLAYIAIADCCPDDAVRYNTITELIYLANEFQFSGKLGKFCINCE